MKCTNCGQEIAENSKFCPYCGGKQESGAPLSAARSDDTPRMHPIDVADEGLSGGRDVGADAGLYDGGGADKGRFGGRNLGVDDGPTDDRRSGADRRPFGGRDAGVDKRPFRGRKDGADRRSPDSRHTREDHDPAAGGMGRRTPGGGSRDVDGPRGSRGSAGGGGAQKPVMIALIAIAVITVLVIVVLVVMLLLRRSAGNADTQNAGGGQTSAATVAETVDAADTQEAETADTVDTQETEAADAADTQADEDEDDVDSNEDAAATGLTEIPAEAIADMQEVAERVLLENAEANLDAETESLVTSQYIGYYYMTGKDGVKADPANKIFLLYKVLVNDTFTTNSGEQFNENTAYYWYCRFADLTASGEDWEVDLEDYKTSDDYRYTFTVDSGLSTYAYSTTQTWQYHGFETLDIAYSQLVSANEAMYDCKSYVEDVTLDGE